jgi:hypothetical protein
MNALDKIVADSAKCRSLICCSDARVSMGKSKTFLVRLWRRKRAEIELERANANVVGLLISNAPFKRNSYERKTDPELRRQILEYLFAVFGNPKPSEAGAGLSVQLVDEFDSDAVQRGINRSELRPIIGRLTDLKFGARIPIEAGRFIEITRGSD